MCSSSGSNRERAVAGERLLHPVLLIAIGTLVINDHLLKQSWPSLLTGKLSDVAGLSFFPAVVDLIRGEEPRLPLARFTQDPRDLLALPAVLLGVWLFRRRDVLP